MGLELAEALLLQFLQPLDTVSLSLRSLHVSAARCNVHVPQPVDPPGNKSLCLEFPLVGSLLSAPGRKAADLSLEEADSMATMCAIMFCCARSACLKSAQHELFGLGAAEGRSMHC